MTPPALIIQQARALLAQGRAAEAEALLAPTARRVDAPAPALSAMASALRALGRGGEAVPFARRAAEASGSMASRHNLASLLGDLNRYAEAETEARAAFSLGGDAPETWLVLARALQGQNRYDEAEAAFRAALSRRPAYGDVLTDLSQLIWMRTADAALALAPIDAAIAAHPDQVALRRIKARLLDYAGDAPGAYAVLTSAPLDGAGHLAAAQAALRYDAGLSFKHAQAALQAGAPEPAARMALAEAHLGLSQPAEALTHLQRLHGVAPLDQYRLALQSTALRMLGDPAYGALYDYDALVRPATIDTPEGWPTLKAYLADLAVSLRALHGFKTHPVGQSLRHGSQTTAALERSDDPAIAAFFKAIDGPIRAYLAALGTGDDPVRARNTGDYRIHGAWSVQLYPNGFHADHVHSQGWLSSACYIDLPRAVSGGGREGWIKFGEPAIRSDPPLTPEHFVQPAPGTLVLFPSYMWHGTIPFSGDETRLSIAFDVVPA